MMASSDLPGTGRRSRTSRASRSAASRRLVVPRWMSGRGTELAATGRPKKNGPARVRKGRGRVLSRKSTGSYQITERCAAPAFADLPSLALACYGRMLKPNGKSNRSAERGVFILAIIVEVSVRNGWVTG
jgi:hypothetical protein